MHSLKILLLLQLLTEAEEWQSVLETAREQGARLVGMCRGPLKYVLLCAIPGSPPKETGYAA